MLCVYCDWSGRTISSNGVPKMYIISIKIFFTTIVTMALDAIDIETKG